MSIRPVTNACPKLNCGAGNPACNRLSAGSEPPRKAAAARIGCPTREVKHVLFKLWCRG